MTGNVVDLPIRHAARNPGNGAREALIEVANTFPYATPEGSMKWADYILAEFWARGFKVVPVEG